MSNLPSWAKIGARVVCIYPGPWTCAPEDRNLPNPSCKAIYTIDGIESDDEGVYLSLAESPSAEYEVSSFSPLITQADDIHMFRKLLHEMPITSRLDRIAELLDLPEDVTSHLDFP